MKKILLSLMAVVLGTAGCFAQGMKLPDPQKTGGKSIMETLWSRASSTEFSDKMLSRQDLSDLLFAAIGVNREDGRMTSPTAANKQEIRVFVFTARGVAEYMNKEHSLRPVTQGDHRDLIAAHQEWVKSAPVILLMVADADRVGSNSERSKTMMAIDAGIVSENINLYCAGAGLVTRPRASMDDEGIKKLLSLGEGQTPLMNNPVGYPK